VKILIIENMVKQYEILRKVVGDSGKHHCVIGVLFELTLRDFLLKK